MASARASATRCRWPPDSCAGIARLEAFELDQPQKLRHPELDLLFGRPRPARPRPEAEGDVVEDAHVAEQGIVLEHEADPPLAEREASRIDVAEQDFA
jgi:hypothetical protein